MRPCTEETADRLRAWLDGAEAREVAAVVARDRLDLGALEGAVRAAARTPLVPITPEVVEAAQTHVQGRCAIPLGRWLLARTALDHLSTIDAAPVAEGASALTCEELRHLAAHDAAPWQFTVGTTRFGEWAKLATGRRFSAGVFHWEYSGIPLSWFMRVPPADLPAVLAAMARAGGRRPMIFTHLAPRRPAGPLQEAGVNASYLLMAQTLERQPELRGIAGASWLRSPDTHRVSPHLACVNRAIEAHGGVVTTVGPAAPDCGVLARSATRKRLFDAGAFAPTIGLTIWPRNAAIAWARTAAISAAA